LKNFDNALPLQAPKNIGVFGNDAGDLINGLYPQSDYEFGVLAMGGGSGTGRLSYVVTPLDAIKRRAEQDNALVQYVLNNTMIDYHTLTRKQRSYLSHARGLSCVLEELGSRRR
jgi:beta-glucosidase